MSDPSKKITLTDAGNPDRDDGSPPSAGDSQKSRPAGNGAASLSSNEGMRITAPASRAPRLFGVLVVDLGEHVDGRDFWISDDARRAAWAVLAQLPTGLGVRLDLGRGRFWSQWLVGELAGGLGGATAVEVVGIDPEAVARMLTELNGALTTTPPPDARERWITAA